MRSYDCYVSYYLDGKLFEATTNACWSMCYWPNYMNPEWVGKSYNEVLKGLDIYISKFDDPSTRDGKRRLVRIINKITPCKLVVISGSPYIKFRLMNSYNQSLVLLSFIRNLWYSPFPDYSKKFFHHLKNSRKHHADPLERITWANKEACKSNPFPYGSQGHSNVHQHSDLQIRKSKELLEWKNDDLYGTATFLCGGS